MRKICILKVLLFFTLISQANEPLSRDFGEMDHCAREVYLVQLLIEPSTFNNERLRTTGFLMLNESGEGYIAPTIEDFCYNLIGRIGVDATNIPSFSTYEEVSGSYVLVEGRFETKSKEEWKGISTTPPKLLRVTRVSILKKDAIEDFCLPQK